MSIEANLKISNPYFRTYVLCVAALSLKSTLVAWWQMLSRLRSSKIEDSKKDPAGASNGQPAEQDGRPALAHTMDSLNFTFFIVGLLYIILDVGCDNAIKSYTYLSFSHDIAHLTKQRQIVCSSLWLLASLSLATLCGQSAFIALRYGMDAEAEAMSHSTL